MLPVLLLLAQPAPADAFAERAWGRFSRSPAIRRNREVVDVATIGRDGAGLAYQLRLTRTTLRSTEVLWADSRSCPAVRQVLAQLSALPVPRIAPPGLTGDDIEVIADGVGYALHMPAAVGLGDGTVDLSSNVGTPLAVWVDGTLATLAPCWQREAERPR